MLILDNTAVEDLEQFSVFITPIPGIFPVAVKNSTTTITIRDNDCKSRITITDWLSNHI